MFTLHASLQSAMNNATSMTTALLVKMGRFGTTDLRRTTHTHQLTWNSLTWDSDSLVVSIDQVQQLSRYAASNWTLTLSGTHANSQDNFDRQECDLYVAYVSGGAVIGDALLINRGVMNIMDLEERNIEVVQPIAVESFWNRGSRTITHARTDDGQRQRFPDDRCFRDIAKQRELTIGGPSVHVYR